MQAIVAKQALTFVPPPATAAAWPVLREVGRAAPCSACILQEHCLPRGLDASDIPLLDTLVSRQVRVRRGERLFRAGEKFTSLYAIHSGSCKTTLPGADGQDQVAGYHMMGDIIGTDGIGTDVHDCEAVALEDMEVCRMPFDRIEELARRNADFQRGLSRLLSREIVREHRVARILGTMRADQRLATFLLDLAERYQQRGYSSVEFVLRMTREEIGSYLGLQLETVSRQFSRFQREGLLQIEGRVVKLLDRAALWTLVGNYPSRSTALRGN